MLFPQYLDRIFRKDPHAAKDFHVRQVALYAEFDRQRLLPFLRSSNYYPLQQALDECEIRTLIPEMVFLLGGYGANLANISLMVQTILIIMVTKLIKFTLDVNVLKSSHLACSELTYL